VLDEVYQHHTFPGTNHLTLRAIPGMADRAVRVCSAGKTFSYTGFKVGWVTGPKDMMRAVAMAHMNIVFAVCGALQRAVAHGLENERAFYEGLGSVLAAKRERLAPRLQAAGFDVLPSDGTYFLVADFKGLLREGEEAEDDFAFCERLVREAGVAAIPVGAFYEDREEAPKTLVRFVTCKDDATLDEAGDRLEAYFKAGKKR
jgi:aspartate/methionine/tyrosine aminotransferase